ncbi:MAG: aspartate carbamoyltransferase [Tissierellia bacterium]|nr:aspartate carbamoyltransferase [Tissierellia bacterium]
MKVKHFIEPNDLALNEYEEIFRLADNILIQPEAYLSRCQGKILASLFFEPSTRTRISFETAMLRLGGQVISVTDPKVSSVAKGESLADTLRILEGYADICAMRHPENFTPHQVAPYLSQMNLINAGDGSNAHPTQTLADILTIREAKGGLEGLKIGFCGDLKYGRTVHSLFKFMEQMEGNSFYLISPEALALAPSFYDYVDPGRVQVVGELAECIGDLDVLYMTRIQKERFEDPREAEALRGSYLLDTEKMKLAKKDLAVLHPLPRVDEISQEVDDDPRALYFRQAKLGMVGRMALITYLLEAKDGGKR